MSILPVLTLPNKSLRIKSIEVEKIDQDLMNFIDDMVDTLRSKPGLGLAAPQVGKNIRLIIIESKGSQDENGNTIYETIPLMVLINPEIIKFSRDKVEMDEGCFSVPDLFGLVTRPKKIKLIALDINGRKVQLNASGLLARVIQHEIDHLDGILFIDHITDKSKLRMVKMEQDQEIEG
jgi:peptide deformylase